MAEDYPDFRTGQNLGDMSALQMQAMVRDLRMVANMQVRPPLTMRRTPGGLELGFTTPGGTAYIAQRVVCAIVVSPGATDDSLTIRKMRYANTPPVEGVYEWDSAELTAYADIGSRISDYASFFTADNTPGIGTPALHARFENGFWIVELGGAPASNLKLVVVRSTGLDADAVLINVQTVIPEVDGDTGMWTGGYVEVPDTEEQVAVYAHQRASDYDAFVWPVTEPFTMVTPILTAVQISGMWHLPQYLRFALPGPNLNLPFSDCSVHVIAP